MSMSALLIFPPEASPHTGSGLDCYELCLTYTQQNNTTTWAQRCAISVPKCNCLTLVHELNIISDHTKLNKLPYVYPLSETCSDRGFDLNIELLNNVFYLN